jgi:hypothetical protein
MAKIDEGTPIEARILLRRRLADLVDSLIDHRSGKV